VIALPAHHLAIEVRFFYRMTDLLSVHHFSANSCKIVSHSRRLVPPGFLLLPIEQIYTPKPRSQKQHQAAYSPRIAYAQIAVAPDLWPVSLGGCFKLELALGKGPLRPRGTAKRKGRRRRASSLGRGPSCCLCALVSALAERRWVLR